MAAAIFPQTEGETIETWLYKATNPLSVTEDWESIVGFCDSVNKELEGPQTAVRLLVHKIQSPHEKESLLALTTLEACVKNCGRRFQQEIGKFRFINELIKVVSPKYLGNYTSEKVKKRCVELLYKWTQVLTHEPKIKEAYQMLRRQGIIKQDPVVEFEPVVAPPSPPPRPKNSIFEEEEKSKLLSRLLRSKNPDDLQAANRLIKNMVKQDAERMEKVSKRTQQLDTTLNNVKLLSDMLHNHEPGGATESDKEIMKELYDNLESQRPSLFRLASDTDERDNTGIGDILKANDEVIKVMSLYDQIINKSDVGALLTATSDTDDGKSSFLKDLECLETPQSSQRHALAAGAVGSTASNSLLDDQLLCLGLEFSNTPSNGHMVNDAQKHSNQLDDLLHSFPAATSSTHNSLNLGSPAFGVAPLSSRTLLPATTTGTSLADDFLPFSAAAPPLAPHNPSIRLPTFATTSTVAAAGGAASANRSVTFGATQPTVMPIRMPPAALPASITPTATQPGMLTPVPVKSQTASGTATMPARTAGSDAATAAKVITSPSVNWFNEPNASTSGGSGQKVFVSAPGLESIDELSKTLLQQNLTTSDWKQFKSSEPAPKLSLKQMSKSSAASVPSETSTATTLATSQIFTSATSSSSFAMDILSNSSLSGATASPLSLLSEGDVAKDAAEQKESRSLADVFVELESIQPGTIAPMVVYNKNSIKITLHFGKDRPRPDVQVIAVSVMSTSSSAIKNFIFQAAVPKVLKVKLQPASGTDLRAYNPILPSSAITQVMLVAHPPEEKIRLKFKISYTIDDGDMTDVGELDGLAQM